MKYTQNFEVITNINATSSDGIVVRKPPLMTPVLSNKISPIENPKLINKKSSIQTDSTVGYCRLTVLLYTKKKHSD